MALVTFFRPFLCRFDSNLVGFSSAHCPMKALPTNSVLCHAGESQKRNMRFFLKKRFLVDLARYSSHGDDGSARLRTKGPATEVPGLSRLQLSRWAVIVAWTRVAASDFGKSKGDEKTQPDHSDLVLLSTPREILYFGLRTVPEAAASGELDFTRPSDWGSMPKKQRQRWRNARKGRRGNSKIENSAGSF